MLASLSGCRAFWRDSARGSGGLGALGPRALIIAALLTVGASGSETEPLFPVDLHGPIYSSPVVADIDRDGADEILVGSEANALYCLDHLGLIRWQYATGGAVRSSPALGDLDRDGLLDAVFQSEDGVLHAVDHLGQALAGWPRAFDQLPETGRYSATPALADLDDDGELEIVTLAPVWFPDHNPRYHSTRVCAFNADGTLVWTWDREWPGSGSFDAITSPAIADMNRDGVLDVVVFFGILYYSPSGPGVGLYVLRGSDGFRWYEQESDVASTRSSPSIADINGDGALDVVVSAFPPPYTLLEAITPETGTVLWSIIARPEVDNFSLSSPAFGDLDEDRLPEIIPGGSMVALDQDGRTLWLDFNVYSFDSSAVLGDIDSDGRMEVIAADSSAGEIRGYDENGEALQGFPLVANPDALIQSTPALCDLDRDGSLEILMGCTDGKLYWWETTYGFEELRLAWPTFKNDVRRTAVARPLVDVTLSPDRIEAPPGGRIDLGIALTNNSHRAQSIRFALVVRLPSGLEWPVFVRGLSLAEYATGEATVSLTVPRKAPPGLNAWLVGTVWSPSGYEVDTDSTLVVVLDDSR
ncbi:MAG: VCBS repeat-containing protein [Planctomycetota bacterium]